MRDPGLVRAAQPLTRGAQYLADRYRLRVPAWELDLLSEPLVPAPAHALPIEYWSGPTRDPAARIGGRPVRGFGFNERTWVFARDFELVDVLRDTLRHLPEGAFPAGSPGPLALSRPGLGGRRLPQPRRPRRARASTCARACARTSSSSPSRIAGTCGRSSTISTRRCSCGRLESRPHHRDRRAARVAPQRRWTLRPTSMGSAA